jgi:hypothetical protein
MTRDERLRSRLVHQAARQHDEELQTLLHQTYRQLEHAYHCSPEYHRMVQRYPALARAIAQCRSSDLIGNPPAGLRRGAPGASHPAPPPAGGCRTGR